MVRLESVGIPVGDYVSTSVSVAVIFVVLWVSHLFLSETCAQVDEGNGSG